MKYVAKIRRTGQTDEVGLRNCWSMSHALLAVDY